MEYREILYKGLDSIPVVIEDTEKYSPEYFCITDLPGELHAGRNLFRFKGNAKNFVENSSVYIEVLDSNGDPIYYEADLDLESDEQAVIVSIYIYQDTPTGIGKIILCGLAKNVPTNYSDINVRWSYPVSIDPSKRNESEIIFSELPTINVTPGTGSYKINTYLGGDRFQSQSLHNLTYTILQNVIPTINSGIPGTFKSGSVSANIAFKASDLVFESTIRANISANSTFTGSISSLNSNSSSVILSEKVSFPTIGAQDRLTNRVLIPTNTLIKTASVNYEMPIIGTTDTEKTYNKATIYFSNLQPQIGDVSKIRCYYRSSGINEYILSNIIELKDLVEEFGFTPNTVTASISLPTITKNDYFDFKFEFVNPVDIISKQIIEVFNKFMPGATSIVEGPGYLTGSFLIGTSTTGSGIVLVGTNSASFITTTGYQGFSTAIASASAPGFLLYSGSVETVLTGSTDTYSGTGVEIVSNPYSYIKSTSSNGGDLRINIGTTGGSLIVSGAFAGPIYSGVCEPPAFTSLGSGSCSIGPGRFILYDNPSFIGTRYPFELTSSTTIVPTNGLVGYIYIKYNSGSPYILYTDDQEDITQSDSHIIYTVYRENDTVHRLSWDSPARGLAEKVENRLIKTSRFTREFQGGLILGVSGTNYVTVTPGYVWYGAVRKYVNSFDSSNTRSCELRFVYHDSTQLDGWNSLNVTTFNNTQYDDGTDLQTLLNNNKWTVNWVYRLMGDDTPERCAFTLGLEYDTFTEASLSQEPPKPDVLLKSGILVGRIIVKKNEVVPLVPGTTGDVQSAFSQAFVGSAASNHNDLNNIQGGSAGEYYHLTSASYAQVLASSGSSTISGSINYIPKFVSSSILGNSIMFENANKIGIQTINPLATLMINGTLAAGEVVTIPGTRAAAFGYQPDALGEDSFAIGSATNAIGTGSFASGLGTNAIGNYSHAEGILNYVTGEAAHAEGGYNYSSGQYSHAEGNHVSASGNWSHAEGWLTVASGVYSHAAGYGTIASGSAQTVVGKYNPHNDNTSLFIVGSGTDDLNRNYSIKVGSIETTINKIMTLIEVTSSADITPSSGSIIYSGSKHYGWNGSSWNAFY